jgi:hypothetical protein
MMSIFVYVYVYIHTRITCLATSLLLCVSVSVYMYIDSPCNYALPNSHTHSYNTLIPSELHAMAEQLQCTTDAIRDSGRTARVLRQPDQHQAERGRGAKREVCAY